MKERIGQQAVWEDKAGLHIGEVTDYRPRTKLGENGRYLPEYVEIDGHIQINPNRVIYEHSGESE